MRSPVNDLTRFVVTLKKDHGLGSNTILHNAVIVAQFLKRHGRSGITKELPLPERITPLVKIYRHEELARFHHTLVATRRRQVAEMFGHAIERGEMRDDVDLDFATDQLSAPLFYRHLLVGAAVDEQYVEQVVADFLARYGTRERAAV